MRAEVGVQDVMICGSRAGSVWYVTVPMGRAE